MRKNRGFFAMINVDKVYFVFLFFKPAKTLLQTRIRIIYYISILFRGRYK